MKDLDETSIDHSRWAKETSGEALFHSYIFILEVIPNVCIVPLSSLVQCTDKRPSGQYLTTL